METLRDHWKGTAAQPETGKVGWKSPSNIALVKYWGKFPDQIPANPSLSFTLSTSFSSTVLEYKPKAGSESSVQFLFEGKENPVFANRIQMYLNRLASEFPFLANLDFNIFSSNTFPHSSGIASSASAMSALGLCLASVMKSMDPDMSDTDERKMASYLARLGSGSACRSVYGGFTVWGNTGSLPEASDLYAVPLKTEALAPVFQTLNDDILIVEKGAKKVSSSAGHGLMNGHPFAEIRFKQAHQRLTNLLNILKDGDLFAFCELVEEEALTLHAMMMTSSPAFVLFKAETIAIISKIKEFRLDSRVPVCFTLDAGANVHMIYPAEFQSAVHEFRQKNLLGYCENEQYLCDRIGRGPELMSF